MKLKTFTILTILTTVAVGLTVIFLPLPSEAKKPIPAQVALSNQSSQPSILVKTVYYQITGSTAKQLRTQLNQLGPFDQRFNQRFDGATKGNIDWNYRYSTSSDGCKISSADVNTVITIVLPDWQAPAKASQQLINQWNRYIEALQVHENGHQQYWIQASYKILQTLKNFSTLPSCEQLGRAANAASNRLVEKYVQQDLRYDRKTRHGRTQGAVFP